MDLNKDAKDLIKIRRTITVTIEKEDDFERDKMVLIVMPPNAEVNIEFVFNDGETIPYHHKTGELEERIIIQEGRGGKVNVSFPPGQEGKVQ